MKKLLACLFVLNSLFIWAQGTTPSKNSGFVLVSLDSASHDFHLSSNISEANCIKPNLGYEEWINQLVNKVKSNPNINPDSVKVTISVLVDNTGQLKVVETKKELEEAESYIHNYAIQLGLWSKQDDCDSINIRIVSKKLEVFTVLDESAKFPGGLEAFFKYLAKNLTYPRDAQRYGVEGRVFIQFIVEKDGSITNAKVVKGIGAGCDEEALRVIKEMPIWIPGKHDGEPVRQKMIQNIVFKFVNPKEDRKKRRKMKKAG